MEPEDNPDALPLSIVLGRPVRSPQGEFLGKVGDLIVRIGTEAHPPVTGLVLRTGNRDYFVSWQQVQSALAEGIRLTSARVDLRPFARRAGEMLLARDLLDHKVIDIERRRVVRVNDVLLHSEGSICRLAGVDAGSGPIFRRLGLTRVLGFLGFRPRSSPLAWNTVEFFASEVPVQLAVSHAGTAEMHPVEIAGMMEGVSLRQRHEILGALDDETAAEALEEMSPEHQADLVESLDSERAASILEEMAPDNAADLLADLPQDRAREILGRMEPEESEEVRELLQYPEQSAGGMMTTDLVAVPRSFTAGEVLDYLRRSEELPQVIHDIYVVASREDQRLVGVVPLREIVISPPERPLGEIMETEFIRVPATESNREVARMMARYDLLALPVVDEQGILLGIVTVDDAMELLLPGEWTKRFPRFFRS
ncbi:MAG TPA: CBS domain-containing protein [Armatimonadota bacterium]|jgi:magnesium transporter|nr:magnesium transporter [Armatimonadota bacterium]HPT98817.1 CBS domain-containing protein [Armatimonadota bacterium]